MEATAEHQCPKCGCTRLELRVMQTVVVEFDDPDGHEVMDGPSGDMEWDETTSATCTQCHHSASLTDMTTCDEQVDPA